MSQLQPEAQDGGDRPVDQGVPQAHGGLGEDVQEEEHGKDVPGFDHLGGAVDCVRAGCIPGGLKANREFAECVVGYEGAIAEEMKALLFDPQTAGGLLVSVDAEHVSDLSRALTHAGVAVAEIGDVLPAAKPLITVIP